MSTHYDQADRGMLDQMSGADFDAFGDSEPEEALFAEPVPMADGEAERLIAAIVALQSHKEVTKARAEALAKADDQQIAHLLAVHGERLQEWTRRRLRNRKRSVRLVEGVAGFRAIPLRVQVADERAALAWCEQTFPAALVSKVDRSAFKAVILDGEPILVNAATGETLPPVPGLEVAGGGEAFYVKSGLRRSEAALDEEEEA